MTITVAHYSFKIPFGVVNLNNKFTFKSLSEKPIEKQFVLSGIYCLSKRVCKIVKKNYLDMPELINYAKALDYKIGVFHIPELVTYIISMNLAVVHLYNYRYCRC